MVTAGHMACEPVTAMRSLSSAFWYRHYQEGAPRHRPGGRGCRDGHVRRHPGGRERGHAASDQPRPGQYDPAGAGRGRGGRRVRPGGPGGFRHRTDRDSWKGPAARGYGRVPEGDRRPATYGVPRAWQVTGAWYIAGAPPGPAPRRWPGRG